MTPQRRRVTNCCFRVFLDELANEPVELGAVAERSISSLE
jgi:hypothetical protein